MSRCAATVAAAARASAHDPLPIERVRTLLLARAKRLNPWCQLWCQRGRRGPSPAVARVADSLTNAMAVSTDAGRLRLSARGVKGGGAKAAALLQPW